MGQRIESVKVCHECLMQLEYFAGFSATKVVPLYINICHRYIAMGRCLYLPPPCQKEDVLYKNLCRLERKGLILSTETQNNILLIKPQGHDRFFIDGEIVNFFCAQPKLHNIHFS